MISAMIQQNLQKKILKKLIVTLMCIVGACSIPATFANTSNNSTGGAIATTATFDAKLLKETLTNNLGLQVDEVIQTQLPGIALVMTEQGIFYSSYDGQFFIQGKIYQVGEQAGNVTNLADASLAKMRLNGLDKFANDMIVYPAKNEKHVVTIFTDITCGYCRKLHAQMDEYNAKGITVRYLAYPRSGVLDQSGELSKGFQDLRSIWCHEDPKMALTKAKLGSTIAQRICDKPIEAEFNFGRKIGVNGTPAIILANGMMIPGYQDPDKLSAMLESL